MRIFLLFIKFAEYVEILTNEFNSYLNKLIHYTFINGLITYDKPCKYSYCQIQFNSSKEKDRRRTESNEIYNKSFKIIDLKINKTKINELKNMKIRKLNGYDHTMGPITESDILDFLLNINDTLYNFIDLYLGKDYKNMNTTGNNFLTKENNLYLQLLKRSIHMIAIKFSTILTLDNYKEFEENLYEKYNNISFYINNNSDIISSYKNEFVDLLKDSSIFIGLSFNLSFYNIKGQYKILCDLIQNKMKYLSEEDLLKYKLRLLNDEEEDEEDNDILDQNNDLNEIEDINLNFKDIILQNKEAFKGFDSLLLFIEDGLVIWDQIDLEQNNNFHSWYTFVLKSEILELDDEAEAGVSISIMKKQISLPVGICYNIFKKTLIITFNIQLASFLDFVIAITPSLDIGACINIGGDYNWGNKEGYFFIEAYGKAEVSLTLDLGLYVPSNRTMFSVSINIGLHGIIVSGIVGCKLKLYLKDEFVVDSYFQIKAFEFSFYIMLKFTISIENIINFSFQIYLFDKVFACAIKYEFHYERSYKYSNKTEPLTCKYEGNLETNFFKKYSLINHGDKCKVKK